MERILKKKKDEMKIEQALLQGRKFTWMPRIDFYVMREFLIPFTILIIAFVLLFMIADVFNSLGDFLDAHSPLMIGVRYFILKIPGNVRFVLPITVLLASMYTIANFGRHQELTAMRASGISLMRCGLSIYLLAFFVTIVNFWFNEALVPQCSREAEIILDIVNKGEEYIEKQNAKLQYHSPDKNRSWFFGQFNKNGSQKDVKIKFMYQEDSDLPERRKLPEKILEAKSVRYIDGKGWEFSDYKLTRFLEGLPSETVSQKPGDPPLILSDAEIPETPAIIEKTIIVPEALPTKDIYHILRSNRNMAPSLRNVYASLFYYRLAFPWVCFLCSFLALPLAGRNERSGIFTAIVNAVIVVVVYQILTEIFMVGGRNSFIPPFIAGTFPTLAFVFYGWFFLIRKAG